MVKYKFPLRTAYIIQSLLLILFVFFCVCVKYISLLNMWCCDYGWVILSGSGATAGDHGQLP